MDTRSVVEHHLQAFGAGDVEDVMSDYTDDAVLLTARGATAGREALTQAFAGFFAGMFKPGTYTFTLDSLQVDGELGHITWHATCADTEVSLGTDTFVVRDGKIVLQTFTAKMDPR